MAPRRYPYVEVLCQYCGIPYAALQRKRKHNACSRSCYAALYYRERHPQSLTGYQSVCQVCGATFQHVSRNKIPICSAQCYNTHRGKPAPAPRPCQQCGTAFVPKKVVASRQQFCSRFCQSKYFREHRPILYYTNCAWCGQSFGVTRRQHAICCSNVCGYQYIGSLRKLSEEGLLRRARQRLLHTLSTIQACRICGKKRLRSAPCSRACQLEEGRRRYYAVRDAARQHKTCKACGCTYQEYKNGTQFCEPCGEARRWYRDNVSKRYRQSLETVCGFRKIDIYRRDKYVCQLCGKKTRPALHYNHDLFPSIDHIIPLADGGTHEPRNVQTAHRICNSFKRHRVCGEQLRMF